MNPFAVVATAVLGLVLAVMVGLWAVVAMGVIGAVGGLAYLGRYLASGMRRALR